MRAFGGKIGRDKHGIYKHVNLLLAILSMNVGTDKRGVMVVGGERMRGYLEVASLLDGLRGRGDVVVLEPLSIQDAMGMALNFYGDLRLLVPADVGNKMAFQALAVTLTQERVPPHRICVVHHDDMEARDVYDKLGTGGLMKLLLLRSVANIDNIRQFLNAELTRQVLVLSQKKIDDQLRRLGISAVGVSSFKEIVLGVQSALPAMAIVDMDLVDDTAIQSIPGAGFVNAGESLGLVEVVGKMITKYGLEHRGRFPVVGFQSKGQALSLLVKLVEMGVLRV